MSVLTDGKVGNVIFIEVICRKPTNSYLVFIFHSEVIQRRIIMQIGIAVFISNTNVNTLCIEVNNAPFADFTGKDHLATEILLDSAQLKAVLLQVLLLLYSAGYNSFLLLLLIRLSGYCSVCTLAALSSLLCNSVQLSHCSISTHRLLVACIRSTFAFSFGERGWFQIT